MDAGGTVYIIDDDQAVRDALLRLFRAVSIDALAFASPVEFLGGPRPGSPCCIVLDVVMPGMSGPELHSQFSANGIDCPVIYLSGNATVEIGVDAMKRGAVDFLEKPIDQSRLVPLVRKALGEHRDLHAVRDQYSAIRRRFSELSKRELEVIGHVVAGRLNKQIALDLGIALKTVKVHRSRAMAKLEARSVAELVRLCHAIGMELPPSSVP